MSLKRERIKRKIYFKFARKNHKKDEKKLIVEKTEK